MSLPSCFPLRLLPGDDLRRALDAACVRNGMSGGFVLAGIGSLLDARLRLAGQSDTLQIPGPAEILTLSGSLADNGAHLHMAVSTSTGQVVGGHVVYGNRVLTTVEVLVASLPDWQLLREADPATGYAELVARRRAQPDGLPDTHRGAPDLRSTRDPIE